MSRENSIQYELFQRISSGSMNNNTRKSAKRTIRQFADWCKSVGINKPSQVTADGAALVQRYEKFLEQQGKTAASIHTLLAYVCKSLDIKMSEIEKPKRRSSAICRGRGSADASDVIKPEYGRLIAFQRCVGIRRSELAALRKNDLIGDESGYLCVQVKKGKGGKFQMQRILPQDEAVVVAYFDGSNERVFSESELDNKINLHRLRAEQARRAYSYYEQQLKEPAARQQARQELAMRYRRYNRGNLDTWLSELDKCGGVYKLRGDNLRKAINAGLPETYDRLALMMVSVFHLSHWRLDVTVTNYMLA
jgi:hypothetical protein